MNIEQLLVIVGAIETIMLPAAFFVIKSAVEKTVERSIDVAFDRRLEKYRDNLSRASRFYSRYVDRQMELFDYTNKQLAELIPLIQDMAHAVEAGEFNAYQKSCFLRYIELIPEMKCKVLEYEPYVDRCFFETLNQIVLEMQGMAEDWAGWAEQLSSSTPISVHDVDRAIAYSKKLLKLIAGTRFQMIKYLNAVTGIGEEDHVV